MSYEIIKTANHKCDLPGDFQTERGDLIRCDCGQLWKNRFLGLRKVKG